MLHPKRKVTPDNGDSVDQSLVRQVLKGERESFRELMLRHKDMIFSMLIRQVGENSIAEDLSQEIFMKAFQKLKLFRFESKFSTWLVRIALNHTSSYFVSKQYKKTRRTDEFDASKDERHSTSPAQELESQQRVEQYQLAFAKLPEKFRAVLSLCALEGKPYEEVAQILKIPVGTVRSRLNKARLLLRAALLEEGAINEQ